MYFLTAWQLFFFFQSARPKSHSNASAGSWPTGSWAMGCPHPGHGVNMSLISGYSCINNLSEIALQPTYSLIKIHHAYWNMLKWDMYSHHTECWVKTFSSVTGLWGYYLFWVKDHISLVVISNQEVIINH